MQTELITIDYRSAGLLQRTALSFGVILIALTWLPVLVGMLFWLGSLVPANSFISGVLSVLGILLILMGTSVIYYSVRSFGATIITPLFSDECTMLLSPGGSIFPIADILPLRGRRWRKWEELKKVELYWRAASGMQKHDRLVLHYSDGCKVTVPVKGIKGKDLEQLLVAIEMWAPQSASIADFTELREYLQGSLACLGESSYTAIWNNELSRKFSLSAFVPLAPGARLQDGRLEVVSQLSFGGFNAVYNGLLRGGSQVVIKELAIDHLEKAELRDSLLEHLQREASLLCKLRHKSICCFIDSFIEKGRYYIVLEKIPGRNLRQIVSQSGPLEQKRVIELALQMAEMLDYLHSHEPPVIHRDFTPDNLILKNGTKLILVDFNAATEYLSGVTGTIIGKHCYMAPEQVRGKAEKATDYYSMACTIFFLLTAKDPQPLLKLSFERENIQVLPRLSNLLANLTEQDSDKRRNIKHIISELNECSQSLAGRV